MEIDATITRPAIRYFGGKWKLAPWVISYFPKHVSYLEPCGGAASVLLQKPRSPLETYNDLDGNVVNFFRVLRDNPDDLIRRITLTPWSREEYANCRQETDDPIERARQFYFISQAAISGSQRGSSGMRMVYRVDGGIPATINAIPDHLMVIAGRLLGVQIENRDALELVDLCDTPQTLIYFDPPYVPETRSSKHEYTQEADINFHVAAAERLNQCKGFVIVSGYSCDLYNQLYERAGWQRVDQKSLTNSGGKRTESLWLNPRAYAAQSQKTLF